jgi:hypothetical protein
MITAKYVVGKGVVIAFSPHKVTLSLAIDCLMYLKSQAQDGSGFDDIIMALTNTITEPPPVKRICEKCWTPIDPRVSSFHKRNGSFFHDECRTPLD